MSLTKSQSWPVWIKCHRSDQTGFIQQQRRLSGPAQPMQSPVKREHNNMGLRMSKTMDRNIKWKGSREINITVKTIIYFVQMKNSCYWRSSTYTALHAEEVFLCFIFGFLFQPIVLPSYTRHPSMLVSYLEKKYFYAFQSCRGKEQQCFKLNI